MTVDRLHSVNTCLVDDLSINTAHSLTYHSDVSIIIIIIIIRAFVRCTMSASELDLRRRQSLGGEDG